ncbi:uncharacterized protein LOC111371568 [Olea europaea var. sylvestris]|uniref:uncharacterized protein LOC111371568 n=1 Tax=Olea europaea var. sylvestris TaxID=158386 RepID=UPI000C1D4612|nr:uncharacterized protein LOC111371568 [Olea europaea var. sylvestris]
MEMIPSSSNGSFNNKTRRKNGYTYTRLSTGNTIRLGAGSKEKRSWRIKIHRRLRLKFSSPLKLWCKLKNAYMNMMLRLARNTGSGINLLGSKRIPKARQIPNGYSRTEFENRLVYEMYKNMVASYELSSHR